LGGARKGEAVEDKSARKTNIIIIDKKTKKMLDKAVLY